MPGEPPALVPGPTAAQVLRRLLLAAAAGAALLVLVLLRVDEVVPSSGWASAVVLASGLLLCWALLRGWAAVGRRNLVELQHGYTTVRLGWGTFAGDSVQPPTEIGVPWDYSGTWVLRSDGRVTARPVPVAEPPGLYPSPHRPGAFELWSGAAWTGQFASP